MFLDLMIAHHRGAVDMVEALLKQPGAAFDPVLYQFVTDVSNEQTAEIKRMDPLRNAFTRRSARRPEARLSPMPARRSPTSSSSPRCRARRASSIPPIPADLPPPKAQQGGQEGRRAAPRQCRRRRRRMERALAAAELRPDRHGVRRRPPVRRQLSRLQHLPPRRRGPAQRTSARSSARAGRATCRWSATCC